MKKRRMRILGLAGALVFALGLGACGQQGGGGGETSPIPGQSTKIVEDIRIKTTPKTNYILSEQFSTEGGVIELMYEDGTTGEVSFSDSKVNSETNFQINKEGHLNEINSFATIESISDSKKQIEDIPITGPFSNNDIDDDYNVDIYEFPLYYIQVRNSTGKFDLNENKITIEIL